MKGLKVYGVFLLSFLGSYGQEAISTDRPDQTETTTLVPKNRFQAEIGVQHEKAAVSNNDFLLPTILVKYGLSNVIELRLTNSYGVSQDNESTVHGWYPLGLGVKIKVADAKEFFPAVSFLAEATIPNLASNDFKTPHVSGKTVFLFQNKITDKIDLGYNLGLNWDGSATKPIYIYTISPNYKLSSKVSIFIESYGFIVANQHAENWIDTGFSVLLSNDIQLDFSAGYELTNTGGYHDFFESAGISFRL